MRSPRRQQLLNRMILVLAAVSPVEEISVARHATDRQ
jgi:hypothetical protein